MYEEEAIEKMKQGDLNAFDVIFERYKNEAVRLAYMITGNRADSEDVVQETFIQCYRKIDKLKDPGCFRAWLFRILTRIAWKTYAHHKAEEPIENISEVEILDLEQLDSSLDVFLKSELSDTLYGAINKLDKKQKTVIILYYYNELSIKEIAKIMACQEGTVKSRLHTARKNLKNAFENIENNRIEVKKSAEFNTI